MARKSSTTTTGPTVVRQRGYAVTVKCFIPMGNEIDGQIAALNTLKEIAAGDLSSLREVVADGSVAVAYKQTSRKVEMAAS